MKWSSEHIRFLKKIDNKLIKYFFRGFLNADEYIGKYSIKFFGDYEHDWLYFDILYIEYRVYKYKTKIRRIFTISNIQ